MVECFLVILLVVNAGVQFILSSKQGYAQEKEWRKVVNLEVNEVVVKITKDFEKEFTVIPPKMPDRTEGWMSVYVSSGNSDYNIHLINVVEKVTEKYQDPSLGNTGEAYFEKQGYIEESEYLKRVIKEILINKKVKLVLLSASNIERAALFTYIKEEDHPIPADVYLDGQLVDYDFIMNAGKENNIK